MRTRLLTLAAVLLAAIPGAARAQTAPTQYRADFPEARARVERGQVREAAYTLMLASAHVREEFGRCRDGSVGERLLAAESQLDGLVAQLRTGSAAPMPKLEAAFAATDRVLAEHHVRLAEWEWANPKVSATVVVGHDLDRAAFHHARGVEESGGTLDPAAQRALYDARQAASRLATGERAAAAGPAIVALRQVIAPALVAAHTVP